MTSKKELKKEAFDLGIEIENDDTAKEIEQKIEGHKSDNSDNIDTPKQEILEARIEDGKNSVDIEEYGDPELQKALKPYLEKGIIFTINKENNTWHLHRGGKEDSGNLSVPANVIAQKARELLGINTEASPEQEADARKNRG